jgi:hypothetical protein
MLRGKSLEVLLHLEEDNNQATVTTFTVVTWGEQKPSAGVHDESRHQSDIHI